MVSNFDRIYKEITSESARVAKEHDVDADALTELVMEIVNIEDQNVARKLNVLQQVTNLIKNAARSVIKDERN